MEISSSFLSSLTRFGFNFTVSNELRETHEPVVVVGIVVVVVVVMGEVMEEEEEGEFVEMIVVSLSSGVGAESEKAQVSIEK